jgi:hypothetical protein
MPNLRSCWLDIIVFYSTTPLECQAASARQKIYTLEAEPTLLGEMIR